MNPKPETILAALHEIFDTLEERGVHPQVRISNAKLRIAKLGNHINQYTKEG